MLIENILTPDGVQVRNKVAIAIQRLKSFEPTNGYWLAFSGGKDSCIIKALADMADVKYEAHYYLTTVDPPELVRFIRDKHPDVIFDYPKESMWKLIVRKRIPPLATARYCCEELKEHSGEGRVVITGVRWAESVRRKRNRNLINISKGKKRQKFDEDNDESRQMVEQCMLTHKVTVNPIIDWEDDEVWEFIRSQNIPYCSLYDEGFNRLGCIGCPMSPQSRIKTFERWPKYKDAYLRAFQRMHDARIRDGLKTTKLTSGQDWFDWWMGNKKRCGKMEGQIEMVEEEE